MAGFGQRKVVTSTPVEWFYQGSTYTATGGVLASGSRDWDNSPTTRIRAILTLGRKTSGDKMMPVRRTTTDAQVVNTNTTIPVTETAMFQVGDSVTIENAAGTDTCSLGTISSISAGVNIVVSSAVDATFASGSWVYVDDGTEVARGFLLTQVDMLSGADHAEEDQLVTMLTATGDAVVDQAQINNYDTKVKSDLDKWVRFKVDLGL